MMGHLDPVTRKLWFLALACALVGVIALLAGRTDAAVLLTSFGAVLAGGLIASERSARKSRKDTNHHGS